MSQTSGISRVFFLSKVSAAITIHESARKNTKATWCNFVLFRGSFALIAQAFDLGL